MRLLTLNIQRRGASWAPKLAEAILGEAPDVVALSECTPPSADDPLLSALAAGGLVHVAAGAVEDPGYPATVVVASRLPLGTPQVPFVGTPFVQAVLEVPVADFVLVGVYFPLDDKRGPMHARFWADAFQAYVDGLARLPAVVVGDWNTGSWPRDIGGGKVAGMAEFDDLISAGWTDAWRSRHPESREFSWYHSSGSGFRIDHVLLSPAFGGTVTTAEYRHDVRTGGVSDHSMLLVGIAGIGATMPR